MRQFISIIILSLLLIGCVETYNVKERTVFYGLDFTDYRKEGFLITPFTYNGEYESVGIITLKAYPEITLQNTINGEPENELPNNYEKRTVQGQTVFIKNIDINSQLDSLYRKAKSMGADAIVTFDLEEFKFPYVTEELTGLEISGFAIKRK